MSVAAGNVHFTYAQLEGIWQKAGGNAQASAMAAAIATAESGGNSAAYDMDSNGTIDRGLWQINSVHGAQSTFDIMGNARAAVSISNNGTDWSPWVTYQTGAYQQYLQGGVPADSSVPVNATAAAANGPGQSADTTALACRWYNPFSWAQCGVDAATTQAGQTAYGIAMLVLNPIMSLIAGMIGMAAGSTLVLIGIFLIVRQTESYQQAKQTVGKGAQTAAMVVAPESRLAGGSSTVYSSAAGTTTVRRGRQIGGRSTVRTERQVNQRPGTQRVFETPVRSGPNRGQTQRTTIATEYGPQGSTTRTTREVLREQARDHVNGNGAQNGDRS